MLNLWNKADEIQLDLLETTRAPSESPSSDTKAAITAPAAPHLLAIGSLREDPSNPRTDFCEAELDELAEDIRRHGILQPIVVHPADAQGRYRIHFGAKRWRAAQRAGLTEVPVVMRDAPPDPYTQVAENQKRHGLTPLDLARFIRARSDAGDSNATIGRRLGMDMTTVAHHLALLELPPELNEAMQTGRCLAPHAARTEQAAQREPGPGEGVARRRRENHAHRGERRSTRFANAERSTRPPSLPVAAHSSRRRV